MSCVQRTQIITPTVPILLLGTVYQALIDGQTNQQATYYSPNNEPANRLMYYMTLHLLIYSSKKQDPRVQEKTQFGCMQQ